MRLRSRRRLAAKAESQGSLRVPPPPPPEQNTPKWRHFRHLPPAGRAEEGKGGKREGTTALHPAALIRAERRAAEGRAPALQRPLGLGSGEAAGPSPRGPRAKPTAQRTMGPLSLSQSSAGRKSEKTLPENLRFSALCTPLTGVLDDLVDKDLCLALNTGPVKHLMNE